MDTPARRMRGRRGLSAPVWLIIGIISLVLLLFLIIKIGQDTEGLSQKEICKRDVWMHGTGYRLLEIGRQSQDLRCRTEYVKVTPDEAKYVIAKALYDCNDMFYGGKYALFTGDGLYCHTCTVMEFTEPGQTIEGLTEYLNDTKVPGSKISYLDALMGYKSPLAEKRIKEGDWKDAFEKAREGTKISTDKKYAVTFIYAKGEDWVKKGILMVGGDRANAAAVGAGGTAAAGLATVAVVAVVSSPPGWVLLAIGGVFVGATAAVGGTALLGGENPGWMGTVVLKELSEDEMKSLGCTYLPGQQGLKST